MTSPLHGEDHKFDSCRRQIFTDGSCRHNGKTDAQAGIGIWYGKGDQRNRAESLIQGAQTNQRAELWAVIRAVQLTAPSLFAWDTLVIWTDSAYVHKGITEWIKIWEKKSWKNTAGQPVANKELWKKFKDEIGRANCTVKLQKVLGHSGNEGNDGADLLANVGAASSLPPCANAYIGTYQPQ
ncbi:hypothetical protein SeMB42_g02948 [Synchytrium endobioticum]|uniref:ribonuclease H n=1 Tax=Synchytrium endobioticum TaxID=286115 RepID=A0A507DAX1_9FUNG|nr:hypothetical protein SeMB42_g02948 [Synchytrium endobioticum]